MLGSLLSVIHLAILTNAVWCVINLLRNFFAIKPGQALHTEKMNLAFITALYRVIRFTVAGCFLSVFVAASFTGFSVLLKDGILFLLAFGLFITFAIRTSYLSRKKDLDKKTGMIDTIRGV